VIIAERKRKVDLRQPWNERHCAEIWREIARTAGIPDEVWSMDGRAGGATEADSTPGVSDRALQDAGAGRIRKRLSGIGERSSATRKTWCGFARKPARNENIGEVPQERAGRADKPPL